jgi:hypothetical protein
MTFSHFTALLIFAFLVSVVFGTLTKDTPRDRFLYGAKVFGAFVGTALVLGLLMLPFPR